MSKALRRSLEEIHAAHDATAKSLARDVMLYHVFCFPDDMDAEKCVLQRRLGTTDSLVVAASTRLEFEIIEAIKRGMEAARDTHTRPT